MHVLIGVIISVCVMASFHPIREIPTDEITFNVGLQSPVFINQNVKPLSAILDKNLVKQTHDFSCGSAALATLLNYYLNENFTESQVIQGLMDYGNKNKIIERRAFSLLDMKRFVALLGYQGAGYKAEMNDLIELDKPCIIPIEFFGYRHFTVLRGIYDNHVFLADPFRGNTSYTLSAFEDMWYENVIFMIEPDGGHTLTALKLSNEDLRYIDENTISDILFHNTHEIPFSTKHEREFFFTLPDEYNKYSPR